VARQHASPILVPVTGDAAPLTPVDTDWNEATIQALVQDHPACLPIREIDPLFADPVPLCREMSTAAGPIDNVLVTASGLPVLVECKLWRNPQARREVVGQILDYATQLSRWTASDLQREISRRTGRGVVELVRAAGHVVDEVGFTDALTVNLRRGRFLLLIVGDGIREGVEAIAEYLQAHGRLHFTLGLVEMPVYALLDGARLVAPRVLARTETITRTVIETPPGYAVEGTAGEDEFEPLSTEESSRRQEGRARRRADRQDFWAEFLSGLVLDDPDQALPRPSQTGHIVFKFPAPGGSSWLSVYRSKSAGTIGLFLSGNAGSPGQAAARMLASDEAAIRLELGPDALIRFGEDWPKISDSHTLADFDDPVARAAAFAWLRRRLNDFVNALRPRIRAALHELGHA